MTKTLFTTEKASIKQGKRDLVLNKGKALALTLILTLTFSAVAGTVFFDVGNANPVGILSGLPSITIQSDGSVVPQTEYIKQEGQVYYLTQNLSQNYRLVINCSNIIFDGQGNIINGSKRFLWGDHWVDSQCIGITLENVKNVTIGDVIIIGFYEPSININKCSDVNILRVQTDAKAVLAVDISGCIWIEESLSNTISNCITGIRLQSGSNNNFFNNTIYLNIHSSHNFIIHNNINVYYASNGFQFPIIGGGSVNTWDDGEGGNYWTDYNGTDVNNDGIGDTPYTIDVQNVDNYPLMQPVNKTYYLLKNVPPEIVLHSPLNQTYNQTSITLNFSVNKKADLMKYSLDGQENITINGNATIMNLADGLHNITVYATDTFGNIGTSETISFTIVEPPKSFPTTLVIASVITIAVTGMGLIIYFKKRKH